MKLSVKLSILIIVLFFNVVLVTKANGQVLTEIFKRMRAHQSALQSLRSNFSMTYYNDQLAEKDDFWGSAVYLRSPGRRLTLRVDMTKPVAESLTLKNDRYLIYRPGLKQAIEGSIDQTRKDPKSHAALSIVFSSVNELKAGYVFQYLGQEMLKDGTKVFLLRMTPKKSVNFKSADFWIDTDGMVRQARINDHNKDSTTVSLSEIKKNERIAAATFQIKLPKDVKVIKFSKATYPKTSINESGAKTLKKRNNRNYFKRSKTRKTLLLQQRREKVRSRNNKAKRKSSR